MPGTSTAGRLGAVAITCCALAATGAAATPAEAAALPAEGSFIDVGGYVYEIVGGAPVRVTDWAAVGGRKPALKTGTSIFAKLADYPRDGTFVRASDGRCYRFVGGAPFYISTWAAFGGPRRALRIDAAAIANAGAPTGSHFPSVRTRAWDLAGDGRHAPSQLSFPVPYNGSLFVRAGQTGRVYKMVGGAPLYVSTWSIYGGPQPAVTVDQVAIERAGAAGPWRFVAKVPPDGWAIRSGQSDQIYVIAGGAPVYVGTPSFVKQPNVTPAVDRWVPAEVDQAVIDRGGRAAPWNHLHFYPADGTKIAFRPPSDSDTTTPWTTYQVTDGEPDRVEPGFDGLEVDREALVRAGDPGPWAHLKSFQCQPRHIEPSARVYC